MTGIHRRRACMYFFLAAGQKRIERKIDQMEPVQAPVQAQPTAALPPPATGSSHVHPKTHGGRAGLLFTQDAR